MIRTVVVVCALLLVSACAGGPKARYFPPTATVQELRVLPDGQWSMALLVQNTARLAIRVTAIEGTLQVEGIEANRIAQPLDLGIAASGVERVTIEFTPTATAAKALNDALAATRGIAYVIDGKVQTSEPGKRTDEFRFESRLSPAPGLTGTFR